jgi:hypothetical protein
MVRPQTAQPETHALHAGDWDVEWNYFMGGYIVELRCSTESRATCLVIRSIPEWWSSALAAPTDRPRSLPGATTERGAERATPGCLRLRAGLD